MKLPRNLHGRQFADHLIRRWSFAQVRQVGSHIQLRSESPSFTISVPEHRPMKIGTLKKILRIIEEERGVTPETLLDGL